MSLDFLFRFLITPSFVGVYCALIGLFFLAALCSLLWTTFAVRRRLNESPEVLRPRGRDPKEEFAKTFHERRQEREEDFGRPWREFAETLIEPDPGSEPVGKRVTKQRLRQIDRQLKLIDAEIRRRLEEEKALERRAEILTSIPGISNITAAGLIVLMPELGTLTDARAASLAGLAPIPRESGHWEGHSFIQGDRHRPARAGEGDAGQRLPSRSDREHERKGGTAVSVGQFAHSEAQREERDAVRVSTRYLVRSSGVRKRRRSLDHECRFQIGDRVRFDPAPNEERLAGNGARRS